MAVAVAGALLALPAAAQARTKSVFVGTPPKNAKAFQEAGADVNDYFPHKVTIRRGEGAEPFDVAITRDTIKIQSVRYRQEGDVGRCLAARRTAPSTAGRG